MSKSVITGRTANDNTSAAGASPSQKGLDTSVSTMASHMQSRTGPPKRSKSKSNKKLSKHHKSLVKDMEGEIDSMKNKGVDLEGMKRQVDELQGRYKTIRIEMQSLLNNNSKLVES